MDIPKHRVHGLFRCGRANSRPIESKSDTDLPA
jgi:hypothetical protein